MYEDMMLFFNEALRYRRSCFTEPKGTAKPILETTDILDYNVDVLYVCVFMLDVDIYICTFLNVLKTDFR